MLGTAPPRAVLVTRTLDATAPPPKTRLRSLPRRPIMWPPCRLVISPALQNQHLPQASGVEGATQPEDGGSGYGMKPVERHRDRRDLDPGFGVDDGVFEVSFAEPPVGGEPGEWRASGFRGEGWR